MDTASGGGGGAVTVIVKVPDTDWVNCEVAVTVIVPGVAGAVKAPVVELIVPAEAFHETTWLTSEG
jgi:hypothetical protein